MTAQVAEQAIPYCNIVCMTGAEMAGALTGYLQTLYDADPAPWAARCRATISATAPSQHI